MLLRLVKKGVLIYEKNSRVFVYILFVKEEEYVVKESSFFLNCFYNGIFNFMVLNFLENDKLFEDDIEELREILNKRMIKGDK